MPSAQNTPSPTSTPSRTSTRTPRLTTTLVTGASSGIGQASAVALARRGDAVALMARRRDKLDEVAEECRAAGAAEVSVHAGDVTDDAAVAAVVKELVGRHGHLDHVVHCAGIVTYGRAEETDAEQFRQVVETNLLGTANLVRHAVPVLRDQGRGSLVVVGSLLGRLTIPEMTAYVVSKWAVRALTLQVALENVDVRGVRVVHVSPGSVDTPIYDKALSDAGGVNTPPPPTISPERVARVVVRATTRGGHDVQTQWLNYAMIGARTLAPWVWNRSVGPVFNLVSRRTGT